MLNSDIFYLIKLTLKFSSFDTFKANSLTKPKIFLHIKIHLIFADPILHSITSYTYCTRLTFTFSPSINSALHASWILNMTFFRLMFPLPLNYFNNIFDTFSESFATYFRAIQLAIFVGTTIFLCILTPTAKYLIKIHSVNAVMIVGNFQLVLNMIVVLIFYLNI